MAAIGILNLHKRRNAFDRIYRERLTLNNLRDTDIESRYRLDRESIVYLMRLIGGDIRKSGRGRSIDPETQVLVTLRYMAKGDFYSETGDVHGVSRSSRSCGLPNCLGAVDGTLVPIIAPKQNEEAFVSRKGCHALNVQAVADADMRFTDVVCRWPGASHDAMVFDNCALKEHLEATNIGHLLGDSGYPLKPFLMTPYLHPGSPAEERFNKAHKRGRVVVERSFGVLKARFRCLSKSGGCLPFAPEKSANIILCCFKLHNLCLERGLPLPDISSDNDDSQTPGEFIHECGRGGIQRRNELTQLFSR
ncbi:HARB1-like protein [Mya arenaria]|uniref:HARB1-like protein n=1 Tax=Mya arenaria TaxID=6604 RepID=A0ABY7FAZ9_MYAAR|nr:HARB1-like protein [Mya arenaria]WAR19859.1 HARB1-like protein [Mya arenaria]